MKHTGTGAVLALVCAVNFAIILDIALVSAALPDIRDALALGSSAPHWLVGSYAATFGGALIAGGRIGDALGARRALVLGIAAFISFSLLCVTGAGTGVLVAGRAGEGLALALVEPAALSLVTGVTAAGPERARALARYGVAGGSGAVAGALAGGLVADVVSWRAAFLVAPAVLAPVGLAAFYVLPTTARRRASIDLRGAILVTGGATALSLGMVAAARNGIASPSAVALVAAGLTALALFSTLGRSSASALLPRGFARQAGIDGLAVTSFLHGAALVGVVVLVGLHLRDACGLGPLAAGFGMAAMRVVQVSWGRYAGRMVAGLGPGRAQGVGFALIVGACALLAARSADHSYVTGPLPGLIVLGLAMPLTLVGGSAGALECVRRNESGLASGLVSSTFWLGGSFGIAIVSVVTGATASAGSLPAFATCLVLSSAAALSAWTRLRHPRACVVT